MSTKITPGYDSPVAVGKNIGEGSSGAFARADHVHEIVNLHYHQHAPQISDYNITGTFNLSLTNLSDSLIFFSGIDTTATVNLPNSQTIDHGWKFELINKSLSTISIKDFLGGTVLNLSPNSTGFITLQANGSQAGSWVAWQIETSFIASGIVNYSVKSNTSFSTSVRYPTYTSITSFSVTPSAGNYLVIYNASSYYTTTPKAHYWAIYKNGTIISDSARQQDTAHSNQTMVDNTMTIAAFNGSEICDVRVSCDNTGTLTVKDRTLILIRLGV